MQLLINWLWQGCLVVGLVAAALRCASRLSATTRYWVWCLTLMLVLLMPAFALGDAWLPDPGVDADGIVPSFELEPMPGWSSRLLTAAWIAWAMWSTSRIAIALRALLRARRQALPFPAGRAARLTNWNQLNGAGRRARLVVSDRVGAAAVLGLGDPLVAVSPATLGRLDDAELDQVVVHEWAHVQRRDDYARIAQLVVRSAAGLHPAVWWIDRRIEIERETACDDYAVNMTGEPRRMAVCLTKLASGPSLASAAMPGMMGASHLTTRIVRLLDRSRNTSTLRSRRALAVAASVLLASGIVVARVEVLTFAAPLAATSSAVLRTVASPIRVGPRNLGRSADLEQAGGAPTSARPETTRQSDTRQTTPTIEHPEAETHRPSANTSVEIAPLTLRSPEIPNLPLSSSLPAVGTELPPSAPVTTNDSEAPTPWKAAADAGVSIGHGSQKAAGATADAGVSVGRGSQKAAVATAGFFSRLGKKIAGSF